MDKLKSCIGLLLLVIALPAASSEIFHWVDEDGVVHFSDWAPTDENVAVSKVVVGNSNPPGYDPGEDENSVLQQAQRMGERWADIKQERDERRREQREVAESRQIPRYRDYDYPYHYRTGYYFPAVSRPGFVHRPPFRIQTRQALALDQLGLLGGPRPHSINSSAHLARVNAGKSVISGTRSAHPNRGHRPSNRPDF